MPRDDGAIKRRLILRLPAVHRVPDL